MAANLFSCGSFRLICADFLEPALNVESFDSNLLAARGLVEAQADGRGSAWFIRIGAESAVLKHYYRGGAVAKISRDKFIWTGLQRTRAAAEFYLLQALVAEGLPVPVPLGARVERVGLVYRCDLITRTLLSTRTLADRLTDEVLSANLWQQIGAVIARFHRAGVWHADLNARNVLLSDAGEIFLIDFDRGRRRSGSHWQSGNLSRLQRSLVKIQSQGKLKFELSRDWPELLVGYQAA